MNKLEANVSLFIITFFAAIQYPFLAGVPETVSHFSFLLNVKCVFDLLKSKEIFLFVLFLFKFSKGNSKVLLNYLYNL